MVFSLSCLLRQYTMKSSICQSNAVFVIKNTPDP